MPRVLIGLWGGRGFFSSRLEGLCSANRKPAPGSRLFVFRQNVTNFEGAIMPAMHDFCATFLNFCIEYTSLSLSPLLLGMRLQDVEIRALKSPQALPPKYGHSLLEEARAEIRNLYDLFFIFFHLSKDFYFVLFCQESEQLIDWQVWQRAWGCLHQALAMGPCTSQDPG